MACANLGRYTYLMGRHDLSHRGNALRLACKLGLCMRDGPYRLAWTAQFFPYRGLVLSCPCRVFTIGISVTVW